MIDRKLPAAAPRDGCALPQRCQSRSHRLCISCGQLRRRREARAARGVAERTPRPQPSAPPTPTPPPAAAKPLRAPQVRSTKGQGSTRWIPPTRTRDLAEPAFTASPRPQPGPRQVETLRAVTPAVLRYAGWFLEAAWTAETVAALFDVDPEQLLTRLEAA